MKIYLVRHGDAIDRATPGIESDEERWLTDIGREEVGWTAQILRQLNVKPDSDPFQPATCVPGRPARSLAKSSDLQQRRRSATTSSTVDRFDGILNDIARAANPAGVVLAGHMPSIGQLVGWLCWNDRHNAVRMRTAGVARVDMPDDRIAPGWGDLRWLLPPKAARRLLRLAACLEPDLGRPWRTFWLLVAAIFTVAVNSQVMNPVLPAVAEDFDASIARPDWQSPPISCPMDSFNCSMVRWRTGSVGCRSSPSRLARRQSAHYSVRVCAESRHL